MPSEKMRQKKDEIKKLYQKNGCVKCKKEAERITRVDESVKLSNFQDT